MHTKVAVIEEFIKVDHAALVTRILLKDISFLPGTSSWPLQKVEAMARLALDSLIELYSEYRDINIYDVIDKVQAWSHWQEGTLFKV